MSDEPPIKQSPEDCSIDPLMGLVSHVNRSKTGISKLQLTIPIELRARLARASRDHSIPQLALIRTAIAAYLTSIEKRYPPGELGSVPDRQEPPPEASVGLPTAPPGTLGPDGSVLVPGAPQSSEPAPDLPGSLAEALSLAPDMPAITPEPEPEPAPPPSRRTRSRHK